MFAIAYGIALLVSIFVWLYIAVKHYDKVDPYCYAVFILVPFVLLGYWIKYSAKSSEAVIVSICMTYAESTILLTILMFAMLRTIGIRPRMWVKLIGYGLAFAHLYLVWVNIDSGMYYESVTVVRTIEGTISEIVAGPYLVAHVIYLGLMFAAIIGILIIAYLKDGTYSRKTLNLYSSAVSLGFVLYAAECFGDINFTLRPFLYVICDVFLAYNYDRVLAHDISAIISSQQSEQSARGYVIIDFNKHFLSCNQKAYEFWPELKNQRVDEYLQDGSEVARMLYAIILSHDKQGIKTKKYKKDGMTCVADIETFTVSAKGPSRGYIIDIRDASEEQRVLDLMQSYNDSLNEQVVSATENIRNIQNKIVSGMAGMIENRDNNTGGHVRRTSDIIKILIDEIRRQGTMPIDETFGNDIVRAAPMHDLGKIIVENSILNKPGKLTDEEYEIMKMHSTKSGEMVMILLDGVEEEHFVKTAYHVARFHHERWDGRGYPEHLVGTMIPIEARIMAIVDVYDALVSKRSYKAPMSFEKASAIMCEGMGTQFDPNMRSAFLGCREKLEDYYRQHNENQK